jgi:hypothetical protein
MAQTKVKLISDGVIVQGNLHSSHGITTAHIGEGSNLYYTDARVGSYLSTNSFATESYVGTQITNLVDSSPATLNTLNELAAALGDDPNFATTTATSIGLKAPLASPSFTGFITTPYIKSTASGNLALGGASGISRIQSNASNDVRFLNNLNQDLLTLVASTREATFARGATFAGDVSVLGGDIKFVEANSHTVYIDFPRTATNSNPTARIMKNEPAATHTSALRFYTSDASGSAPNLVQALLLDQSQNATFAGNITAPGLVYNATNKYLSISHWSSPPTPAAILHLSDNANNIDVPQIRIEGRENPGDTKLDISVKDPDARFNLIENTSDAYAGYGLMIFKTNAVANSGAPTRGGFNFQTPAASSSLFITNEANVGIGTSSPMSGTNNLGLQIAKGAESSLFMGNPQGGQGAVFQTSDNRHRAIIGANVYDDPSSSWNVFTSGKGIAGISILADTGGWGTSMDFWCGDTDSIISRMTISSNGNVNIGTTYAGSSAVTGPFVVSHTSSRFLTSSYESSIVSLSAKNNNNNLESLKLAGDSIYFFNGTNTTGSQSMVILNNSNVGIGTTSPITKLHVSNAALINDAYGLALVENTSTGTGSAANSALNIKSKYGTSQFMQWENQGLRIGSRIVDNSAVGDVYFTAGADSVKMVIKAGGNVGIGVTSPLAQLDVQLHHGTGAFNKDCGARIGRIQYGWHTGQYYANNSYGYVHYKTNLWMGGSQTNSSGYSGNSHHIMGGFVINSFKYGPGGIGRGEIKFHNWSGVFHSLVVENTGNWTNFVQSPYTSSDGFCVIVLAHNYYSTPNIDFHQTFTAYAWRNVQVTASSQSNNTTGVY